MQLEVEAAVEATCLWLSQSYDAVLQTLERLETTGVKDPKVSHNLVVAGSSCGTASIDQCITQLNAVAAVLSESEDISSLPVAGAQGAKPRSGPVEAPPLVKALSYESATCQLNTAILLYKSHQYGACAELLDALYHSIGFLPEGLAVRCLTLLLDLCILAGNLPRAVALLSQLEKSLHTLREAFCTRGGEADAASGLAAGAVADSRPGVSRQTSEQSTAGATAEAQPPASGQRKTIALPPVSRWHTQSMEKARDILEKQGVCVPPPDLKLLIRLYRTKLHALAGSTRPAKGELKAIMAQVDPSADPLVSMVRAQVELLRGCTRKCAKQLMAMSQDAELNARYRAALLNNMGIAHHQQGKHRLAALLFSQALTAASAASSASTSPPTPAPANKAQQDPKQQQSGRAQGKQAASGKASRAAAKASNAGGKGPSDSIADPARGGAIGPSAMTANPATSAACEAVPPEAVLYNAGLQHLLLRNYALALKCFTQAAALYHHQPLLWLRMAESALGLHQTQHGGAAHPLVAAVLSNPSFRHVVLNTRCCGTNEALQPHTQPGTAGAEAVNGAVAGGGAGAGGAACGDLLQQAVSCLLVAQSILDTYEENREQWQGSVGGKGSSGNGGASADDVFSTHNAHLPLPLDVLGEALHGSAQAAASSRDAPSAAGAAAAAGSSDAAPLSAAVTPMAAGSTTPRGTDAAGALMHELHITRQAVLANLAYMHLLREDWGPALAAAQELMTTCNSSCSSSSGNGNSHSDGARSTNGIGHYTNGGGSVATAAAGGADHVGTGTATSGSAGSNSMYSMLGTSYAAEALCHLDRPTEAVELLSMWILTMQQHQQHSSGGSTDGADGHSQLGADQAAIGHAHDDDPSSPGPAGAHCSFNGASDMQKLVGPDALAATYSNLAAVFASQGELGQAQALARQALAMQPSNSAALLLLLYCELSAGQASNALALIRQGQRAVPSV